EVAAQPDRRTRKLLFFLRIAGWAIIGLILGLGQGIRENTREDLFACSLGGLLGGLLGGSIFDPIASLFAADGGSLSRAVADVVVAAAIGGSMRLLQQKVVDDSGREPTPLTDILPTNSRLLRLSSPAAAPGGHGRHTPASPRVRPPEPVRPKAIPIPRQAEQPLPREISLPQRPSPASTTATKPSLAELEARYPDREEAMARAHREGAYSLSEIGKHFGVPASTVRRAIDR
ncbi:MAG: hypothetical protein KDD47_28460, partial [Acidobacteria bacterium]|nr:hypothetical protein [Acidobacteriota bacterium]